MKNELFFDTIDGKVKAVKRFDVDCSCEFYDCYLLDDDDDDDDGTFIGTSYSNTEEGLENDINDFL